MIGLKTASNGLGGKPWFTSDLKFDHCGFNNPCYSAFLAPKCFFEPFLRKKEGRKEGQNGLVDLRARTSPQVKFPT